MDRVGGGIVSGCRVPVVSEVDDVRDHDDETAEQEIARILAILDHGAGDATASAPQLFRRVIALERRLRQKAERDLAREREAHANAQETIALLDALTDTQWARICELRDDVNLRDRSIALLSDGCSVLGAFALRAQEAERRELRATDLLADVMQALNEREA